MAVGNKKVTRAPGHSLLFLNNKMSKPPKASEIGRHLRLFVKFKCPLTDHLPASTVAWRHCQSVHSGGGNTCKSRLVFQDADNFSARNDANWSLEILTKKGREMKSSNKFVAISTGFAMALLGGISAMAGGTAQSSAMHNFSDGSVIAGTEATLVRMAGGVHITIDTVGLTPGNAVTAWFVVFNSPENCSGGECGEDDIFNLDGDGKFILNTDGSPPMNMDGIGAANISLHRADGLIVDAGGNAQFQGSLVVGDVSEAIFGGGLVDAHLAEIHVILRDHGAAIAGNTDEMVNTMSGGCAVDWPNEPCEDIQIAVFKHGA